MNWPGVVTALEVIGTDVVWNDGVDDVPVDALFGWTTAGGVGSGSGIKGTSEGSSGGNGTGGGDGTKLTFGKVDGTGFLSANSSGVTNNSFGIFGLGGTFGVETMNGMVVSSASGVGPGWNVTVLSEQKRGLKGPSNSRCW